MINLPRHKCGLYLNHNEYKDIYANPKDWIEEQGDLYNWENNEAKEKSISTGEIWTLHWYPDTPIGFYSIAAPTLEDLLVFSEKFVEKEERDNVN